MNLLSLALAVALQGGGRAPPPPVAGCVMLRIDVAGGRRVGVSAERGHGCGPLTIIADSNATFDPARHLLRLRLSIVNGWAREVALPARVRSWNDSITIATWGGMPPSVPREAVRFVGEEVAWSYDSLLGGAKANRVLMPGQHSNARTIDMLVRTSEPVAFYVVLRAEAQNAHPLPEYPPQHTASDYLTGERVVVDGWRLPSGRVLAEVVEMRFDSNASPQERQAAVDSLRGTVIGATAPSGLDERIYFVRLPADSARPPIISIVERGRGFWPQYVRPIVIDSLLAPGQGRSPLFLSPVIGCTTLRIRLTGGAGLNVDSIHAPGCGPIVPVLTLGASYDPNTRVIRLPIALENRWTRQVVTPARLFAWNDSIEVLPSMPPSPPPGRSPPAPVPGHPLPPRPPPAPRPPWLRLPDPRAKWLDSDSAIGAGAKLLSGARLWRYDSSVATMSGRGVLAPLERSADRVIELQLDTAKIDEITVRLRAQAENAHFVPALPPLDAERVGSFDISHRIADPPGLHAMPVVADLIDVTFAGGSTQEERQSVVDSVRGEVVGGYRRTDRGDGTYVVRIPFDSTGAGLVTALGIIRAQPGFILAMPLDAENGPMRYAPYYPPALVRGCSNIRIALVADRAMASVVSGPFCGPVIPVLAGSAKYDAATHALSLPIAIANQWSREVTGPMELYAWNDSISIAAPAGLINGEGGRYLSVEPPPDGGWSDDATIHSGVRWSYDRIVDTVPGSAMLPPGAQTPSRTLLIRLSAGGATAFTVRLRVEMRNAHAVQWGSPERLPAWVSADSALERGQFSKHVLAVTFRNGTSYQAMQAAVDSVRGTVIGGDHLSGYYVKVPSDGSWEGVDRVAKRLKALPQVLFAIVYIANLTIGPN